MRFGVQCHSLFRIHDLLCNLNHTALKPFTIAYSSTTSIRSLTGNSWIKLIRQHTVISCDHLTPEIRLHLITPDFHLWSMNENESPFQDPFWAFYWPGGQALARFILDNPSIVRNKTVLDFGCGSGACAIAAALSNAKTVVANDIDHVACIAAKLNAEINHATLTTNTTNLIGQPIPWDCILIGDMFYDAEYAPLLFNWLRSFHRLNKVILIGDVGRLALKNICVCENLTSLAVIELPDNVKSENNGFTSAEIWSL